MCNVICNVCMYIYIITPNAVFSNLIIYLPTYIYIVQILLLYVIYISYRVSNLYQAQYKIQLSIIMHNEISSLSSIVLYCIYIY